MTGLKPLETREHILKKAFRKVLAKTNRALRKYQKQRKLQQAETLIISYPKSGRTWLRVLLNQYITQKENLGDLSLDLYETTRKSSLSVAHFHHEQAHHPLLIPFDALAFDMAQFKDKRTILLHRDPRDTVASMYFQLTKREPVADDRYFEGSMSDLLRDKYFGLKKIIGFNRMWLENGPLCRDFLAITYEELHREPARVLKEVLQFLGERTPDPELIDSVCCEATFEKMKRAEKASEFDHESMGARIPGDDDSLKVRKGKVGGFREYFSQADLEYSESVMKESLAS